MKWKSLYKLMSVALALCLFFSVVPINAMAEQGGDSGNTPAPTASVEPTAEASPTPSDAATPTPGEEVTPTPGEETSPTPGEEVSPVPSEEPTPAPSEIVEPAPEDVDAAIEELTLKYSTLEEMLAAYPTLESLLADYPVLEGVITEYPPKEAPKEKIPPEPAFEDPDGLGSPQYAENERKSGASSSSGMTARSLMMATSIGPEWPDEGAVYVDKSASGTGTQGEYQINLQVFGKNTESTSDIVLVLDDSGSMSGSKVAEMKAAANDFVDGLIDGSGNIRIAIVTINGGSGTGEPGVIAGFTSNATTLHNAINGVSAGGGTNLQGGL